jgi:WD40 repeat protein
LIASGAEDGEIRVWRHDGTPLAGIPKAHDGPIVSIAMSPSGDLVTLGGDESVRLWKRTQGTQAAADTASFAAAVLFTPPTRRYPNGFLGLFRYNPAWGWDRSVAFSPKGDVIAAVLFDGSLRLWNADGTARAVVANAHTGQQVRALAFSSRGDILASAGFDGTARLWNLDGSPHGAPIDAHMNHVFSVSLAMDGARLATVGHDNAVRVWNRDGSPVLELPKGHTDRVMAVALASDKPLIAVAYKNGAVRLWNLDGTPSGQPAQVEGYIPALAFSPTEETVALAGTDGWLRLWDFQGKPRGRPVAIARDGRRKVSAAFSPEGDMLAVGSSSFHLWKTDRFLWKVPVRPADDIITIAFSSNSDFIVTGSALGDIQVWNLDGSSRVGPLKQRTEWIAAVAVPPEGDYFAAVVGGRTAAITLFNLDGTPRGAPLEGHLGTIKALAFAPKGQLLASGAEEGVRLWNIPAGTSETLPVGLPIDQIGFTGNLLWARSKQTIFFFNRARELVATVHLRSTGLFAWTPDGWFSGTGNALRVVRAFARNGTSLKSSDAARYLAPHKVMEAFTSAAQ